MMEFQKYFRIINKSFRIAIPQKQQNLAIVIIVLLKNRYSSNKDVFLSPAKVITIYHFI